MKHQHAISGLIDICGLASRVRAAVPVGVLLLGLGACDHEMDDGFDLEDPEEELDTVFRSSQAPNRDRRALNKPIQDALDNLSCQSGAELDKVKNYFLGDHVQSFVYTGPFSDGTARTWYSRSDNQTEEYEIKRNKVSASQVESDGTIDPNGGDIDKQDSMNVGSEDHVSQLEWLPDYGSATSYQAGYLFVTSEDNDELRIYYYHKDNSGDPTEVTSSSTRLERNDGDGFNQVYIVYRHGYYWLVMGKSSNFEVWKASDSALFPSGAGSLDPTAFSYHGEYSPNGGGGANCFFIEDSLGDLYRICYDSDDDDNCGGNNRIYATEVTITAGLSFSIASSHSASVNLGSWGWNGDQVTCVTSGIGMGYPSFRASGTHYVDANGGLNVYSMAFGGKDSGWANSGKSDGRVEFCSE